MGPALLEELAHNGPLRIPDEYDYHQLCDKFDLMRSTPPVMRAPVLRGLWFPYIWQRIVAQRRLSPRTWWFSRWWGHMSSRFWVRVNLRNTAGELISSLFSLLLLIVCLYQIEEQLPLLDLRCRSIWQIGHRSAEYDFPFPQRLVTSYWNCQKDYCPVN